MIADALTRCVRVARCAPDLDAWARDDLNKAAIALLSEDERQSLRDAYANKMKSLRRRT